MLTSSLLLLASLSTGLVHAQLTLEDLYLDNAPSSHQSYVIPHYANSHAVTIDSQLYRFTVTGPSSGNVFTLMNTNAPSSGSLGVLPHIHHKHYENFFSFKGRFQLWAQKGDNEQQARVLTRGDYGSGTRNTTHTFQILDPDTEMVGVIVPGGFE
jgi:quercetin dioxygenase-like cupin family protein